MALEGKDESGIMMLANYKNVIPYTTLRTLVNLLLQHHLPVRTEVAQSVITEIIHEATKDTITLETVNNIIRKWNLKMK